MDRSGGSGSTRSPIPFRSKKPVQSTPKAKKPSHQMSIQTPDKQPSSQPLPGARRARNRGVAFSVKDIRMAASASPSEGKNPAVGLVGSRSARRQIYTWPEEKPASPSPKTKTAPKGTTKIPQKYETLLEFYQGLDNSIRLLRLKGSSTTLTNISPKIECLTDRRFTYRHLAQLKYILPEAIELKKVLTFDERTSCMKPDLHVTIDPEAIQCDAKRKSESKNMQLRRVFHDRLIEFYKSHPEEDDVPEDILPPPFNQIVAKGTDPSQPVWLSSDAPTSQNHGPSAPAFSQTPSQIPINVSHFPQTFQRHFSQKVAAISDTEETHNTSLSSCFNETVSASPLVDVSMPSDPATPVKLASQIACNEAASSRIGSSDCTPLKLVSTLYTPMSKTPALCPPKRSFMSPEDETESTRSPSKLGRRPVRSRSLKFDTPVKAGADKPHNSERVSSEDDISNIISGSLLESIREKERKAKEEKDPAISQAKRRRQMIACLPKLFNMIHFMFQSVNRSVLTKEELVFKISSSHSDIVDSREVEEQLELLLELAPEWISKKLSLSGDLLIRIDKTSSPDIILAQLESAK